MKLEDLEEYIEKNYSLDALKKLYKLFISQIINYEGDIKLDTKELTLSAQKNQKKELSKLLSKVFFDSNIFKNLLALLPDETIKVFNFLIWEKNKFKVNEVEKLLMLEDKILLNATKNKSVELNEQYNFFCLEKINNGGVLSYEYKIFIPDEIRYFIKSFFEAPENIKLSTIDTIDETEFNNTNSNNILKIIYLYFTYINTNKVDLSKERPSKAVLRNIKDYCEIEEFFNELDNKDLEYVKTEIFHTYLKDIDIILESSPNELIKTVFNYFISDKYSLDSLLFHIKGKNNLKENEYFINKSREFKNIFLELFSTLPHNKWVEFDNFQKSLYYRDIPELIDKEFFESNTIYFDELKKSNNYSYSQKTLLNEDNYYDIFFTPLLKGIIFLFSSIGLIDIAYNYPKNSLYLQKNQSYLSIFDEIKYLKLNDIGASILGHISDLEYKMDEDIKIELDQEYLIVRVNKEDKIKCSFIESIAVKVKENTFIINEKSFVSNCKSIEAINNKIKNFNSEISDNPGKIWEDFFYNLKNNIINTNKIDDIEVFELPDNNNLLRVLSEENSLSELFYKIENLKIAIKKENINILNDKLFDHGIYIKF